MYFLLSISVKTCHRKLINFYVFSHKTKSFSIKKNLTLNYFLIIYDNNIWWTARSLVT